MDGPAPPVYRHSFQDTSLRTPAIRAPTSSPLPSSLKATGSRSEDERSFDLPLDHSCGVSELFAYRTLRDVWVTRRQPFARRLTPEEIAWMDSPAALVRG